MQLTRFTDYCLRVLMYLGFKQGRISASELTTIAELAERYQISANHLMKVVHHLAQSGYIQTVRGKGGGMRLLRAPADINLGEVVADCEESTVVMECLGEDYAGDCPLMPRCELRRALKGAQQAFMEHLGQYSLQDLVSKRGMQDGLRRMHFADKSGNARTR